MTTTNSSQMEAWYAELDIDGTDSIAGEELQKVADKMREVLIYTAANTVDFANVSTSPTSL